MFFLSHGQRAVQSTSQLGQPLWESLSGPADLTFTPTLPLSDHRMHTLLGRDDLLVATRAQCLRFALPTFTSSFQGDPQTEPRVGQQLLNLLELLATLPASHRPKP